MKKWLITLLLILFGASAQCQITPQDVATIVNDADFIFEGIVIRSDPYRDQAGEFIYTSHTVEISKIFKGSLTCGTVELITAGGRVGDDEISISHNLTLQKGSSGIFACVFMATFEAPIIDYFPESNSDILEVLYSEQGFFQYYPDPANPRVTNMVYSLDSLAHAYNMIELHTQLNYIECYSSKINLAEREGSWTKRQKRRQMANVATIEDTANIPVVVKQRLSLVKVQDTLINKILSAGDTITYSFANAQLTGGIIKYFEFDIMVKANDNNTYLDGTRATILYPQNVFGQNIKANGKVFLTRGLLVASTTNYDDPIMSDNASGGLNIYAYANPSPSNRSLVTTTPQSLVHVKIEIQDCNNELSMYLDPTSMLIYSLYSLSPGSTSIYQYKKLKIGKKLQHNLCLPTITGVSPVIVHGGVGETITITGSNFGNTPGRVFFTSADGGVGASLFTSTLSQDIVSWSNTQIVCRVPSFADTITIDGEVYKGIPGSGLLQVMSNTGDISGVADNPSGMVTVEWSVSNAKNSTGLPARTKLVNSFSSGGYQFYPNAALRNNPQAWAIVQKGIKDWRCQSTVNFTMKDSIVSDEIQEQDVNKIILGQTFSPAVKGQTTTYRSRCAANGEVVQPEVDMVLRAGEPWWYDTLSVAAHPIGTTDFYQVVLHELGHGHLLNHVVDSNSVLNWTSHIYTTHRAVYLSTDPVAGGAQAVINHSTATPMGCGHLMHQPAPCNFNGIHEHHSLALSVFPNPSSASIRVQLPAVWGNGEGFLRIHDSEGRECYARTVQGHEAIEIDISSLAPGIYHLSAEKNTYSISHLFIKD